MCKNRVQHERAVRFFFFASQSLTPEVSDLIVFKQIKAQVLAGSFVSVRDWILSIKITL